MREYTGIDLCPSARVIDLTTAAERDTVPGFSFHVGLSLDRACDASFRRQLAAISPPDCAATALRRHGCTILDVARHAGPHATIIVVPADRGHYDMRFYS